MSMTPEERRARDAEKKRRYREANRDKWLEKKRRYYEANKEKEAELKRKYYEANKEKEAERKRRLRRQKCFAREDGLSLQSWHASLHKRSEVFEVIANLKPDPGQTLAELIHELSGYAMEVCEQIANPTVIEDSPTLTPPPAEDLF